MFADMPFLDHLEEMRRRLLVVLAVFCLVSVAAFFFSGTVVRFLTDVLLRQGSTLIAVKPAEKFLAYLKIAMASGAVAAFPVFAAETALFVLPALGSMARKMLVPAVVSAIFLGLLGCVFSLFALVPFAFGFFAGFARGDGIENFWSFGSCVDLSLSLLFASALAFQFPWLLAAAMKLGILDVRTLEKFRRHVIVFIFIVAAVITPPDIFSQSVVALSLWVLFELTVLAGKLSAATKGGPE